MKEIIETPRHKVLRLEAQFPRAAQLKIIELRDRIDQLEKELKLAKAMQNQFISALGAILI